MIRLFIVVSLPFWNTCTSLSKLLSFSTDWLESLQQWIMQCWNAILFSKTIRTFVFIFVGKVFCILFYFFVLTNDVFNYIPAFSTSSRNSLTLLDNQSLSISERQQIADVWKVSRKRVFFNEMANGSCFGTKKAKNKPANTEGRHGARALESGC